MESGDSEYGSGYSVDNSVNSEGESVNLDDDSVNSEDDSVISSGEPPVLTPSYGDDNETNYNTEKGKYAVHNYTESESVHYTCYR